VTTSGCAGKEKYADKETGIGKSGNSIGAGWTAQWKRALRSPDGKHLEGGNKELPEFEEKRLIQA
jgi:hypothetical protein